jgi:LPS-assembly protein
VVNDFLYNSQPNYLDKGLVLNYNALVKNVNVDSNNSNKFKDKFEQSLSTVFQYNTSYPLIKEEEDYLSYFTPKISLMYSPNKTKNLNLDNLRIDSSKIFSFNRIANNETVEGGASITYGTSFSKTKKGSLDELLNFEISSLARLKKNLDLPESSTLGKKSSDVFGSFEINPSNIFKLKYNFAIDNNLDKSNYDAILTTLSVNKFITTFEYSDEKNNLINQSYTSNTSSYKFDKNNSINLNIRRNNDLSATEYYNLIYSYKNDCLAASVKFNKEFYKDSDLEPEKEIFFTLSLLPFGSVNTLN